MRRLMLTLIPVCTLACTGTESTNGAAGSDGTSSTSSSDTTLQPPETGIQIASGETKIAAGAEAYKCWTFDLPADAPLSLVAIETQLDSPAIHHYGVFTNSAGSDGSEAYDCDQMGATWGLVTGGGLGTPPVKFPDGTAMTLAAGSHLILQLHLINTNSKDVTVEPARVNLVGVKDGADLQPVGLVIAGTLTIDVPAQTKNVNVSGSCMLSNPMEHIFMAYPHMHKLGRHIMSKVTPADGSGERTLADITWDFSDQGIYKADGSAAVGDTVSVTCTYDNAGSTDVKFGLSSNDEMCLNVLYYYPADTISKFCGFP